MTIEQLTQFQAVMKHGSYIAAAQALGLHPSTISKSISALEKELGGPVLNKHKGQLILTDTGSFLLSEGGTVLQRFSELTEQAKRLVGNESGSLTVITSHHLYKTLTDTYRQYHRQYPQVSWSALYTPGTTFHAVVDAVLSGTADFGLVPTVELLEDHSDLRQIPFYTSPFVLVVGTTHPLADHEFVTLAELGHMRLLMNRALRANVLVHLSCTLVNHGYPPLQWFYLDPDTQGPSTDDFFFMQIAAGSHAAIAARVVAESYLSNCRLLPIQDFDETVAPFHVSLIFREGNRNPALLRLLELAAKQK